PVGQGGAGATLRLPLRLSTVEEAGLRDLLRPRDGQLALGGVFLFGGEEVLDAARLDAGEEGGEPPELFAFPVGEGVIVALVALAAAAEQTPRGAARRVLRLDLLGGVKGGGVPARAAGAEGEPAATVDGGGEQFTDHLVIAGVFRQALPEPGLEPALLEADLE